MKRRRAASAALSIGLALSVASACSIKSETAPSSFYLLTSLSDASGQPPAAAAPTGAPRAAGLVLAVGPVRIPAYLDRPQIVTRGPGNEVRIADFERWAEPLGDNIATVLAEDLSALVPADRIERYPGRSAADAELRVEVEVIRFDGALSGDAVLEARWSVLGADADTTLSTRRSRIVEPTGGAGYAALVAALNRALQTFGREVAGELRRLAG